HYLLLPHRSPLPGLAVPRAPPSFPTRRSSDLVGDYGDGSAPPDPITPVDLLRVDPNGTVSTAASDMSFANGMVLVADGRTLIVADRKSTRLNSSHVSISYAVFCLKKKINVSRV